MPERSRWLSRVTATTYGIAGALTLDEFALWFDLQDDYWTKAGRKSIDAVALFGALLTAGVAGRGALRELALVARRAATASEREYERVERLIAADDPPSGAHGLARGPAAAESLTLTLLPSPIRPTSATSRSSPTSTTASRRWPTGSSS